MATRIAVTNQKGGVGKTTTSINLAYYLAKAGHSTLLLDFDPQGNATSGLGVEKPGLKKTMTEVILGKVPLAVAVMDTRFEKLRLAPATPHLANAEVELNGMSKKFVQLKNAIKDIEDSYEYIIIDSPPSLSLLTVNGLVAADYLIIPVQTEFYALEGVGQLLETMKLLKSGLNPNLRLLGVVATMFDSRTSLSTQVLTEIQKFFKDKVFETTIPRNVRLAEAPSHGVPVGAYDRFSKGARAYKKLAGEVIRRVERNKK
jgi:chromosome partitioning protein